MRELGEIVEGWKVPGWPSSEAMDGRYVRLEALEVGHAEALYEADREDTEVRGWDYLFTGPYTDFEGFRGWVEAGAGKTDPVYFAIHDKDSGRWGGAASYMRIKPEAGSIEVGGIWLAPCLQRTRAATEAMVLMMARAFEAGYRRYEWKCNALNLPSRRAAERLGFSFEGTFRQAMVVKGRNRDTAWFAVTDREWPALEAAFGRWLAPENFDGAGQQIERLGDLTGPVRVTSDPVLAGGAP